MTYPLSSDGGSEVINYKFSYYRDELKWTVITRLETDSNYLYFSIGTTYQLVSQIRKVYGRDPRAGLEVT